MKKFKSQFKFPCNFHSSSPQAESWRNATQESHPHLFDLTLYVEIDGELFRKQPKHMTGVINQRSRGGKWERLGNMKSHGGIEEFIKKTGAFECNFKGAPRVKKPQ